MLIAIVMNPMLKSRIHRLGSDHPRSAEIVLGKMYGSDHVDGGQRKGVYAPS